MPIFEVNRQLSDISQPQHNIRKSRAQIFLNYWYDELELLMLEELCAVSVTLLPERIYLHHMCRSGKHRRNFIDQQTHSQI